MNKANKVHEQFMKRSRESITERMHNLQNLKSPLQSRLMREPPKERQEKRRLQLELSIELLKMMTNVWIVLQEVFIILINVHVNAFKIVNVKNQDNGLIFLNVDVIVHTNNNASMDISGTKKHVNVNV